MVRTTLAFAVMLSVGAAGCVGSLEDMQASEQADALGAGDLYYEHVGLPGTECHEFDALTLKADGAYVAKLAAGSEESGTYTRTATKLKLKKAGAFFTRNYKLESDEGAIQLTRKGCSEVLQEAEPPTTPTEPTDPEIDPSCAERTGGALVTFNVADQKLSLWITNAAFIARAKELVPDPNRSPEEPVFNPTPLFEKVIAGYDACSGRQWSVDPERVGFADFTVEVCDAEPAYIDANVAAWVASPGYYCPWGPTVISVEER
jgi:hypothetical protein